MKGVRVRGALFLLLAIVWPVYTWLIAGHGLSTDYSRAPPGQILYVLSKLAGLLAMVVLWIQLLLGLLRRKLDHANSVISIRQHRYLGFAAVLLLVAHVLMFVFAVWLRTGEFPVSLFLPVWHDYYHTGLFFGQMAFVLFGVAAYIGLSGGMKALKSGWRTWLHRLSIPAFFLILLHSYMIGSESRWTTMIWLYPFMIVSVFLMMPGKGMKNTEIKIFLFAPLFFSLFSGSVLAGRVADWPAGMSFVGLVEGRWNFYIVEPGEAGRLPRHVALKQEPRTPAYSPGLGLIAYISPGGDVILHDLKDEKEHVLLQKKGKTAWTQPVFVAERRSLILVEMEQGKSRQTTLIEVTVDNDHKRVLGRQRTAQFDPAIRHNTLYYSNVHCIENCAGRYVQEIWTKNLISQDAHQLTLMNALTRQPAVSPDGRWLYVVSDKQGGEHIWRCKLTDRVPLECSRSVIFGVTDDSPSLSSDGVLYFLSKDEKGRVMVVMEKSPGHFLPLPAPKEIGEIRDMRIGR